MAQEGDGFLDRAELALVPNQAVLIPVAQAEIEGPAADGPGPPDPFPHDLIVGPVLEIGALVLVALVVRTVWASRSARTLPLVSVAAITLALLVWALVVLPANAQLSSWQTSRVMPPDWARWRDQWQFGQAFIFLIHIVGFSALVVSSVEGRAQDASTLGRRA